MALTPATTRACTTPSESSTLRPGISEVVEIGKVIFGQSGGLRCNSLLLGTMLSIASVTSALATVRL
jgi:hypothetical protein